MIIQRPEAIKKREITMTKENSKALKYLVLGIFLFFIIASIPVLIFSTDKIKAELGLFVGAVMAAAMAVHTNIVINKSLYMESRQTFMITANTIGRLLVVMAILVVIVYTQVINVITVLVGLLGLKISAYLQPLFIKKFNKSDKEELEGR